jgi:PST family polysaccharide transporter
MTFGQRVFRSIMWSLASNWGRQAASLLVLLVLARVLDAAEFGLFAIAAAITAAIQVYLNDGLSEALLQRAELQPEHLDTAFWLNGAVGTILALALAAVAPLLASLFGDPELGPLIQALSLCLVLGSLAAVPQAVLRRRLEYRLLAMRSFIAVTGGGVVGVAMALRGYGVWSLAGQQLTENTVGLLVLADLGGWQPRLRWSTRRARELMPYTASIAASRGVMFLYYQIDRLLIGYFLGPVEVGIYNLAQRVLTTVQALVTDSMSTVTLAALCRLQNEPDEMRAFFLTALEAAALVTLPAFIGVAAVAPELIPLLFGAQWVAAGRILHITALTGVPRLLVVFTAALARAIGQPGWYLFMMALGLVAYAGTVLALVSRGLEAVAWGLVAAELVMTPVNLWLLRRLVGLSPWPVLRCLLPAATACLVMVAGLNALHPWFAAHLSPHAILGATIVSGAALYLTTATALCRHRLGLILSGLRQSGEAPLPASAPFHKPVSEKRSLENARPTSDNSAA